jgi:hypothetical protein
MSERERTHEIIDAEDILARARDLIECASNAAAQVWGHDSEPVTTTLEVAGEKIGAAIDLLKEHLKASGYGSDEAYAAAEERLRGFGVRPEGNS